MIACNNLAAVAHDAVENKNHEKTEQGGRVIMIRLNTSVCVLTYWLHILWTPKLVQTDMQRTSNILPLSPCNNVYEDDITKGRKTPFLHAFQESITWTRQGWIAF